jgi:hypothetical protein
MRFRRKSLSGAALLAALVALSSCASTAVLSSWKEPSAGPFSFRKVLVVSSSQDPSVRRMTEDELASRIQNTVAVPSYRIIPDNELGNDQAIRNRAKAAGFDGVIVMRVVSVDREATWVPGVWSGPYYAYGGWPTPYDPGYMQVDTLVRVETNVYSLPEDQLVWASATQTVNPDNARDLVKSTAGAVAKEMRKQGFLR